MTLLCGAGAAVAVLTGVARESTTADGCLRCLVITPFHHLSPAGVSGEFEKGAQGTHQHGAQVWRTTRTQMMASSSSPSPSRTRAAAHASEQDPCEAVAKLAELILAAEHCVFVTGAGISTNAGIRDYLS